MIQTIKTLLAVLVIVTTVGVVAANSVIPQASAAGGCVVGQGSAQNGFPGFDHSNSPFRGSNAHVLDTPGGGACVPDDVPNLDVPP
jgi:hypothetical protein